MIGNRQDKFEIELHGTVTQPPTTVELLEKIAAATVAKLGLLLNPGEVRVLSDYLEEK